MERKRVMVIGHTYAAPANRLKFDHMARDDRFEFLMMAPKRWRNLVTRVHNPAEASNGLYTSMFVDVWFGRHPALYVIPRLGSIIRRFEPHLIYCEQEPICLVSSQAAFVAADVPTVYFTWENVARRDLRYRMLSPVRAYCLGKSLLMAAGSKSAASVMRGLGYAKPIYITPLLGVSEDLFFPQDASTLRARITRRPFLIGYVGRFKHQKGVGTLLKAAASLNRDIDWHLALVGGGPEEDKYLQAVRTFGIGDRVSLHPPVPHDGVPDYLNCFDVLALPSRTTPTWKEQFGHVLVEAMACGVPVVGSSSGAIPDVMGEAGLVFAEGDTRDLSAKLTALHDDAPLRERLRETGLQRVRDRYTDRRIAQNMLSVCEIALGMDRTTPNTLEVDGID